MRLWIDDIRPAPTDFVRVKTANEAKAAIRCYERAFSGEDTIVISIGNDVEEFEARTLDYSYVQNSKEKEAFEKIFGDELMSAQELSEGLSLLWDSKDADEGFGDIFD